MPYYAATPPFLLIFAIIDISSHALLLLHYLPLIFAAAAAIYRRYDYIFTPFSFHAFAMLIVIDMIIFAIHCYDFRALLRYYY